MKKDLYPKMPCARVPPPYFAAEYICAICGRSGEAKDLCFPVKKDAE